MPWGVIFWVLTILYFNIVLHLLYKEYRRGLSDPSALRSHTFHLRIGLTFLSFLAWAVFLALYLT